MVRRWGEWVERAFRSWAGIVLVHPWLVLSLSLAITLGLIAGLTRLRVDVTFEAFLDDDDPVLLAYHDFTSTFGRDERILISAERGPGEGDVFDLQFLERLRALHEALETRVPHLEEVTSLVNARDTRGEGDVLHVDDFLDPWPETEADLARLRERARSNPLFRNTLLSADARVTALTLELDAYSTAKPTASAASSASPGASGDASDGPDTDGPDDPFAGFDEAGGAADAAEGVEAGVATEPPRLSGKEEKAVVDAVHALLREFASPQFVLHVAGSPVVLQDLADAMGRDMPRFLALAIGSIAVLLFALYRRLVAVWAPLLVVGLTTAATFGAMGWTDNPVHVPTQILPSLLLAGCIGDSVHLLSIFYQRRQAGSPPQQALVEALGHAGLPILLTSLTTAGGLASFATSQLAPIAAIGIYGSIGVMWAFLLSVTLLPAIMVLVSLGEARASDAGDASTATDRWLAELGRYAVRRPGRIVTGAGLLAVLALFGALKLRLSHDPLVWLPAETPIAAGTRAIDAAFGGSVTFEVLLETPDPETARAPETLRRLAALGQDFETRPRDGRLAAQSVSLADIVKEIHRALNEDRASAYVIPDDADAIAQEMLLFESAGSDDLEDVLDAELRTLRMAVRMPWQDSVQYLAFFEIAEADVAQALGELGETTLTGVFALLVRAISAMVRSMVWSYVLAFAVITALMIGLLGSLRWGLLSMIPNLLPILLTLGLMGYFGFPLDAFTLLIGAIALGLAVDDTIHAMHHIRREYDRGADIESAVVATLRTTGRAMLCTSLLLGAGFLGFTLSSMGNLVNFGLLTTFAIAMAFVADVLLGPALLSLMLGRRRPDGRG